MNNTEFNLKNIDPKIAIEPRALAGIVNKQSLTKELKALGCVEDPAREGLWIAPNGKVKDAKRSVVRYGYPVAIVTKAWWIATKKQTGIGSDKIMETAEAL